MSDKFYDVMKNVVTMLLASLLLLASGALFAQNDYSEYNKTDSKQRRQGKWVDFYPNGQIRYEGAFKDNRCVGDFTYYDEQGRVKAINSFDKTGKKALNKTFSPNGVVIATGTYLDQKKDGEWHYYSEHGKLILVECYIEGEVDGWSRVYNPLNGKVSEETMYVQGRRHGEGRHYSDNGILIMECQYADDNLNGPAKVYYPTGAIKEEGAFKAGAKDGIWKAYDLDGNVISSERYGCAGE